VLVEIVPAQDRAIHAGKDQMRAVIAAQAYIVEPVVVEPGKTAVALFILPDPLGEAVLDLLVDLARGDGLLLVDDARILVDLVVDRGRPAVQRILDRGVPCVVVFATVDLA
jgi:hypothetical protein